MVLVGRLFVEPFGGAPSRLRTVEVHVATVHAPSSLTLLEKPADPFLYISIGQCSAGFASNDADWHGHSPVPPHGRCARKRDLMSPGIRSRTDAHPVWSAPHEAHLPTTPCGRP